MLRASTYILFGFILINMFCSFILLLIGYITKKSSSSGDYFMTILISFWILIILYHLMLKVGFIS